MVVDWTARGRVGLVDRFMIYIPVSGSGGSSVWGSSIVAFLSTLHVRKKMKEKKDVLAWLSLCMVGSVPTGCDRYKANCQPLVSGGGQRFHAMEVAFAYRQDLSEDWQDRDKVVEGYLSIVKA